MAEYSPSRTIALSEPSPLIDRLKKTLERLRRSVLVRATGVYLAASWAALQVVDTLAGFVALPEWLPMLALTLIVVGLPVVLATAVVQRRVGGPPLLVTPGEPSRVVEPVADEAPGSDEPGPVPDAALRQLFTWRNTILGGVAATVLWAGVAAVWLVATGGVGPPEDVTAIRSVAVLPFADMSQAGDQEYFSDGLTEELLNALARVPGLRVPARTSSFAFKGRNEDIREIGRSLNVEAVLEGSVRKQGDQLRITAQLIGTESGYHMWSQTFDGAMSDVFALQERIARSVARLLEVGEAAEDAVAAADTQAALRRKAPTADLEAYELYLRGRYALNQRTPTSLDNAIDLFRQALGRDPAYAEAWAGLAHTYNFQALNLYERADERFPLGLEAARRALELDPDLAEAHAARATALYLYEWDWDGAGDAFRRALSIDADYADARYAHSMYLSALRRNEAAIREAHRAARLDPLSPPVNMGVGMAYFHAGRMPEATAAFRRAIELAPEYFFNYSWLGLTLAQQGDAEAAAEAARRGLDLNPGSPITAAMLAETLARVGSDAEARDILTDLERRARTEPVTGSYLARAWIALGDHERALDWIERAVRWREGQVVQIGGPGYEPVRTDPRFGTVLDALDFP